MKTYNIGILGFGTVGSGVFDIFSKNADIIKEKNCLAVNVKRILDLRKFPGSPAENLITTNFDDIVSDNEISLVVEVLGGEQPAFDFCKQALAAKKSVVTSNKELVEKHGAELMKIAFENGVHFLFEASVAGGIPVIRCLNESFNSDSVIEISGILNGTTNYILTKMTKDGQSFEDALADAQSLGYAEQNPSADVEGTDACRKLAILLSIATGKDVDCRDINTKGIDAVTTSQIAKANEKDGVIKLVAKAKIDKDNVFAQVAPMFINKESSLFKVDGALNAVSVRGSATGEITLIGMGAGKLPTASAIASDIIAALTRRPSAPFWCEQRQSVASFPAQYAERFSI